VLLAEKYELVQQSSRNRIHQIAVLDNGSGMDATVLRMALQFGNGTRLEAGKRTGMGRFGMGLPSASISQCRRVEVWSWQGDITKALYTYLDLDDIEHQRTREIPIPQQRAVPKLWLDSSEMIHSNHATGTGTLVVWSHIDRSNWSTSKAIIKNSEFVVGRMYRHFLYDNTVRITMRSIKVNVDAQTKAMRFDTVNDSERAEFLPHYIQPNDPLHLHPYHQLPAPWDKQSMFEPFKDLYERIIPIKDEHGQPHDVIVRTSISRPDARKGDLAGAKEHGKHAARNVGISIVRAGRELDMDEGQVIQHDPVERWWGMEILFPPALDEVFGVTNNKQAAVKLRELLSNKSESTDGGMFPESTPLQPLLNYIKSTLSRARAELKNQTIGNRTPKHNNQPGETVQLATAAIEGQTKQGGKSATDTQVVQPHDIREAEIKKLLIETGKTPEEAQTTATTIVRDGRRANIEFRDMDTSAFFSIRDAGGVLFMTLNSNHPLYTYFFELSEQTRELSDAERIRRMRIAIEMLLFSWARMEDESAGDKPKANLLRRIREEWGTVAADFLEGLNEHK
jgi:hypothetical protein